ncbi:DUF2501 domain-containing protein [Ottowia thiooxydans]|uniref:DUF2501 domain-containing protein n=1 Tax=Ottowia thiooxydans TaxID=219182 RepID=UPI0003FFAF10|nr:DUF2501 domain-containing protein [Ottowia thiooxydans]
MKKRVVLATMALFAAMASPFAHSQMLDALKDRLNQSNATSGTSGDGAKTGAAAALASGLGLSMPSIGSSSLGNAAGVLEYCVKNNYLSADAAGGVKDKLLGMVTGQKPQQTGYDTGVKGLLQGSDGKSMSLDNVGSQIKTKACDYVLSNAKSLI